MKYCIQLSIKILLLLFILFPFIHQDTEAQRLGLGIKAGMNVNSHLENFRFVAGDIDLNFNPEFTTGFNAGVIWRQGLSNRFRFQAEPTITMLGASYNDTFVLRGFDFDTESKTELLYLQLPLLLQLTTVPPEQTVFGRQRSETTFHLSGGIFGGYLINARFSGTNRGAPIGIEFEGEFSEDVRDQYKEFDGGVMIGGGLEYGYNTKIGIEMRIKYSVLDSGDTVDFTFKPKNIAASIAVYYIL